MWKLTRSIADAPSEPEEITLEFERGLPSKLAAGGKTVTDGVEIFLALNALARKHGIGRIDIVENRFIGVKSRGCYETPAGTILRKAHMDLEGLTVDRNVRALRDGFVTAELSKILYNGYWFSPEREFVMSCLAASQKTVTGQVRLALFKGNVIVQGRSAPNNNLYDASESSMDELGGFEPTDTSGFIKVRSRDGSTESDRADRGDPAAQVRPGACRGGPWHRSGRGAPGVSISVAASQSVLEQGDADCTSEDGLVNSEVRAWYRRRRREHR